MESSLTHGVANGQERFPDELALLEELGLKNLNDIEAAIKRYNIDCDYERTGVIDVATQFHSASYLDELREDYHAPAFARPEGGAARRRGRCAARSTRPPTPAGCGARTAPRSSTRHGSCGDSRRRADVARRAHLRGHQGDLDREGRRRACSSPRRSAGCAPARWRSRTNAFKPLLKRIGHYIAPVYDYCMVTEPLTTAQLAEHRLDATGRASATSPTSSTTTDSPRTTGSCGAATTPSTSGAAR